MGRGLLTGRNLFFALAISFQAVFYFLVASLVPDRPDELKKVDYVAFYTAGYIARYEGISGLYDLALQQKVEEAVIAPVQLPRFYPFNHPPILVRLLQWSTTKNYLASYVRWVGSLSVFQILTLGVLAGLFSSLGWRKVESGILLATSLLFYPIFSAYLKGQDSIFLLLGISLWTFGILGKREKLAGLGLALAAIRPQLALALAVPFIFKKRNVWWWFLAFGAVLLVYCSMLVGMQGMRNFLDVLRYSSAGTGIDTSLMPTLMGAIIQLAPAIDPTELHVIGYAGYLLAIAFLCLVWWKSERLEIRHIGLALLVIILFSPHFQHHDLSLLIVPAVGAALELARARLLSYPVAALLPLVCSLIMTANAFLQLTLINYFLLISLGLLLWIPGRLGPARRPFPRPAA